MGARFRLIAGALVMATALCVGAAAGRVVGPIDGAAAGTDAGGAGDNGAAGAGSGGTDAIAADVALGGTGAADHAGHGMGSMDSMGPTDGAATGTGTGEAGAPAAGKDEHAGSPTPAAPSASTPATPTAAEGTEGLLASAAGYTLIPEATVLAGLPGTPFRFRITDRAGVPVRDYEVTHERPLHLVLVSRDLATYFHLHPDLGPDGTWTVALPLLPPGAYRAFADFTVAGGPGLVLGVDLFVPGGALYVPLPPPGPLAVVPPSYGVGLTGTPAVGAAGGGEVALTVTSGGLPVTDLQPYLGALGHLVVIRASDLAFVHAHPLDVGPSGGPTVRFHVAVSQPGDYRMFFEFSHAGAVHMAPFTVHVAAPPP
jgi:hypothetical protein